LEPAEPVAAVVPLDGRGAPAGLGAVVSFVVALEDPNALGSGGADGDGLLPFVSVLPVGSETNHVIRVRARSARPCRVHLCR